MPRFGIPEVTEWLLNSPRIARDGAPFFWTFLDTPQDGSIILTWQPLQRMGTEFASDGYIWPRGETYYQHEIRDGLILEVFHQPMGYRPGEEYATHSRRRFRLMPPKVANPNAPQVDPSLWLVHYGPVDEREPTPVKKIRLDPRLRAQMDHRQTLQRAGQITRKEFMLSDRVNWPQIPLPHGARVPPGYATAGVPQQMAYPPAAGGGSLAPPPPAKRARHSAANAAANAAAAASAAAAGPGGHGPAPMDAAVYEDEEEYTRGDMFDTITPRDVSLDRYKQNHEWMEEIISSPYRISQIGYADLGLGLKGELAPVTEGIFEGQAFDASQRVPKNPYVGKLDGKLADDFRKRVEDKIAATNNEIEEMKARHEKLVASLHTNSAMKKAEHDLRFTAEETGPEIWRVEGRLRGDDDATTSSGGNASSSGDAAAGDGHWSHQKHHKTVDEVVSQVENTLGRKVVSSGAVVRVQDGGYREPSPEPEPEPEPEPVPEVPSISAPDSTGLAAPGSVSLSQHPSPAGSQLSGILIGDADMDMGETAGMLDQMESVFSPASTPVNFPTPTPAAQAAGPPSASGLSNVATPNDGAAPAVPSAAASVGAAAGSGAGTPAADASKQAAGDVAMSDASSGQPQAGAAPGTAGDDWVVVPPGGGVSPTGASGATPNPAGATAGATGTTPVPPSTSAVPTPPVKSPDAAAPAAESGTGSKPESAVPTPGAGAVVDSDFGSLADMSTGGDPLTSIDDGLDLNMDMDDSAFGDAFHGSGDN